MKPALGVTDPVAIALACAKAYGIVGGNPINIRVQVDSGIYKNGYSCGIPGTEEMGNHLAAILGVVCGNPEFELEVLRDLTPGDVERAKVLKKQGMALIEVLKDTDGIWIDTTVTTDKGIGQAIIKGRHSNIIFVAKNGETVFSNIEEKRDPKATIQNESVENLTLQDFNGFISTNKPGPQGQVKYRGFAVFIRNHTRNLNRFCSGFFRHKQKRLRA